MIYHRTEDPPILHTLMTGETVSGHFKPRRKQNPEVQVILTTRSYSSTSGNGNGYPVRKEPAHHATSLQGIQGVLGAICTGSGRFKHIEPHRNVGREGSMRFDVLEPHRTSAYSTLHSYP